MIGGIAWACVAGGFMMIVIGGLLSWRQLQLQTSVKEEAEKVQANLQNVAVAARSLAGADDPAAFHIAYQRQIEATTSATEYLKALSELAKSLAGLTPAVAAFVVSTILFFFAVALVSVDRVTDAVADGGEAKRLLPGRPANGTAVTIAPLRAAA